MNINNFDFTLPEELIAQFPLNERTASRLLVLNKKNGEIFHKQFTDLPNLLQPKDLLVFNNTKVIPARMYGQKPTGGKIEILIERILDTKTALAKIKSSKKIENGARLIFENAVKIEVLEKPNELYKVYLHNKKSFLEILNQYGHIPLPPYIKRQDNINDKERYQTVFAKLEGAVAAPTASLHFDNDLIEKTKKIGVNIAFITLHVGAGTFAPVRTENILKHKMHSEYMEITKETCDAIMQTKKNGGRIIAVGTTSVRCLETAAQKSCTDNQTELNLKTFSGETDIFIYPGYKFLCVDAMITNFHLPKSTLLMLVSAFAGRENILHAYEEAIKLKYRFFSYGDAMMIN